MTAARKLEDWQVAWIASRNDPVRFVREVLGAEPEPWQAQALQTIAERDRVAIRAGHGVGKTALIAWVVLWFLLTRYPAKVPITANSQDQLRDVVWAELKLWHARLPEMLRDQIEVTAERVQIKAAPELGFAVARTATKERPEALQGFHSENLLFVVEEASGIPEEVFTVAAGAMSTDGAKTLMLGNPTRLSGTFFDAFHRQADRWAAMRVNCEDVPRARGHIADIVSKYGRDSNAYRIRVQGDFPTAEDDAVIPRHLIDEAVGRVVERTRSRIIWGVDVARFGDDRTVIAKRQGNHLIELPVARRNLDTMQVAGWINAELRKTPIVERPETIAIDVLNMGAGVVDRLLEMGWPAVGVNVGEAASADDRFMRLRDEMWWRGREWLETKAVSIPRPRVVDGVESAEDRQRLDALIADLTAPTYTFTSTGKIVVEPKSETKKPTRYGMSPDVADAFLHTFAISDLPSGRGRSAEPQVFDDGV